MQEAMDDVYGEMEMLLHDTSVGHYTGGLSTEGFTLESTTRGHPDGHYTMHFELDEFCQYMPEWAELYRRFVHLSKRNPALVFGEQTFPECST